MKKFLLSISIITAVVSAQAQNVGIGTATPTMKLHVSSPDSALLLLQNQQAPAAGVKTGLYFEAGNRFGAAIKTEYTNATDARLGFFTFAGTDANALRERLSIGDNGYIGIGKLAPSAQLHIYQSTAPGLPSLLLEEAFDSLVKLNLLTTHPNNPANNFWTMSAYNNSVRANERINFTNNSAGTLMSLTGTGKLGIRTTNPLMNLHVNGADSAVALFTNSQAPAPGIKTAMYFEAGNRFGAAIKTEYTNTTDARLGFFTFAGTDANTLRERLSIGDNGYVGIGEINPAAQLHVYQSTLAGLPSLLLEEAFDDFARLNFKSKSPNNSGNNFWTLAGYNHNTRATERLNFNNNAAGTLMSLTGAGNLGLGTTNPTSKLHVIKTTIGAPGAAVRFTNATGDTANVVEITNATGAFGNGLLVNIQSPGFVGGAIYAKNTGTGSNAIVGEANFGSDAWAIYGISAAGEAGHFQGNVNVVGTLSKSAGTFKIDHPLDPANKYLIHSFVESPDMMNVYNGNAKTDATGKAIVSLPSYFEAENIDFKYQLTIVDEAKFAMARISKRVANNKFEIMTDQPNIEVSWQVTGVRNDAYAVAHRIIPEVEKKGKEAGKYIHPELFGGTEKQSIYFKESKPETKEAALTEDPSFKLASSKVGVPVSTKKN